MPIPIQKNSPESTLSKVKYDLWASLTMIYLFDNIELELIYKDDNNKKETRYKLTRDPVSDRLVLKDENYNILELYNNKSNFEIFIKALYDTVYNKNVSSNIEYRHLVEAQKYINKFEDFYINIKNVVEQKKLNEVVEDLFTPEKWMLENASILDIHDINYTTQSIKEFTGSKHKQGEASLTIWSKEGQSMVTILPSIFLPSDTIVIPQKFAKQIPVDITGNDLFKHVKQGNGKIITHIFIDNSKLKVKSKHTVVVNGKQYVKIAISKIELENNKYKIVDKNGVEAIIDPRTVHFALRQIMDGEKVIFTRFPQLAGISWAAKKIIINNDPSVNDIFMNPSLCKPYNADFDGDTMRIFYALNNYDEVHVMSVNEEGYITPKIVTDKDNKKRFEKTSTKEVLFTAASHEANYGEMAELAQQTGLILDKLYDVNKNDELKNLEQKIKKAIEVNGVINKYNKKLPKITAKDIIKKYRLDYNNKFKNELDKLEEYIQNIIDKKDTNFDIRKGIPDILYNEVFDISRRNIVENIKKYKPMLVTKNTLYSVIRYFSLYDENYIRKELKDFLDVNDLDFFVNMIKKYQKDSSIIHQFINDIQKREFDKKLKNYFSQPISTLDHKTLDDIFSLDHVYSGIINEIQSIIYENIKNDKLPNVNDILSNVIRYVRNKISSNDFYINNILDEKQSVRNAKFKKCITEYLTQLEKIFRQNSPDAPKNHKDITKKIFNSVDNFSSITYNSLSIEEKKFVKQLLKKVSVDFIIYGAQQISEILGPTVVTEIDQSIQFLPSIGFFKKLDEQPIIQFEVSNKIQSKISKAVGTLGYNITFDDLKRINNFCLKDLDSLAEQVAAIAFLSAIEYKETSNINVVKKIASKVLDSKYKLLEDKIIHNIKNKVIKNISKDTSSSHLIKIVADNIVTNIGREYFSMYRSIAENPDDIYIISDEYGMITLSDVAKVDYGVYQMLKGLRGKSDGYVHMAYKFSGTFRTGKALGSELIPIMSPQVYDMLKKKDVKIVDKLKNKKLSQKLIKDISTMFGLSNKNYFTATIVDELLTSVAGGEGLILRAQAIEIPGFIAKLYDALVSQGLISEINKIEYTYDIKVDKRTIKNIFEMLFYDNVTRNILVRKLKPVLKNEFKKANLLDKNDVLNITNDNIDKVYEIVSENLNDEIVEIIRNQISNVIKTKMNMIIGLPGSNASIQFAKYDSNSALKNKTPAKAKITQIDKNFVLEKSSSKDRAYINIDEFLESRKVDKFIKDENKSNKIKILAGKQNMEIELDNELVSNKNENIIAVKFHEYDSNDYKIKAIRVPTLSINIDTSSPVTKNEDDSKIARALVASLYLDFRKRYKEKVLDIIGNIDKYIKKDKFGNVIEEDLESLNKELQKIELETFNEIYTGSINNNICVKSKNYKQILENEYKIKIDLVHIYLPEFRLLSDMIFDINNNAFLNKSLLPLTNPVNIYGPSAGIGVSSASRVELQLRQTMNSLHNTYTLLEDWARYILSEKPIKPNVTGINDPGFTVGRNIAFVDFTAHNIEDAVIHTGMKIYNNFNPNKLTEDLLKNIGQRMIEDGIISIQIGGGSIKLEDDTSLNNVDIRRIKFKVNAYYDAKNQTTHYGNFIMTYEDLINKHYPIINKHTKIYLDDKVIAEDSKIKKTMKGILSGFQFNVNRNSIDIITVQPILAETSAKLASLGANKGVYGIARNELFNVNLSKSHALVRLKNTFSVINEMKNRELLEKKDYNKIIDEFINILKTYFDINDKDIRTEISKLIENNIQKMNFSDLEKLITNKFEEIFDKHFEEKYGYINLGRDVGFEVKIPYYDKKENKIKHKTEIIQEIYGNQIFITRLEPATIASILLSNYAKVLEDTFTSSKVELMVFEDSAILKLKNDKGHIKTFTINGQDGDGIYDVLRKLGIDYSEVYCRFNPDDSNFKDVIRFLMEGEDKNNIENVIKNVGKIMNDVFSPNSSYKLTIKTPYREMTIPAMIGRNIPMLVLKQIAEAKGIDAGKETASLGTRNELIEVAEFTSQMILNHSTFEMKVIYTVNKDTSEYKIYFIGRKDIIDENEILKNNPNMKIKTINVPAQHVPYLESLMSSMILSNPDAYEFKKQPQSDDKKLSNIKLDKNPGYIINKSSNYSYLSSQAIQRAAEVLTQKTMKVFHQNAMAVDIPSPEMMGILFRPTFEKNVFIVRDNGFTETLTNLGEMAKFDNNNVPEHLKSKYDAYNRMKKYIDFVVKSSFDPNIRETMFTLGYIVYSLDVVGFLKENNYNTDDLKKYLIDSLKSIDLYDDNKHIIDKLIKLIKSNNSLSADEIYKALYTDILPDLYKNKEYESFIKGEEKFFFNINDYKDLITKSIHDMINADNINLYFDIDSHGRYILKQHIKHDLLGKFIGPLYSSTVYKDKPGELGDIITAFSTFYDIVYDPKSDVVSISYVYNELGSPLIGTHLKLTGEIKIAKNILLPILIQIMELPGETNVTIFEEIMKNTRKEKRFKKITEIISKLDAIEAGNKLVEIIKNFAAGDNLADINNFTQQWLEGFKKEISKFDFIQNPNKVAGDFLQYIIKNVVLNKSKDSLQDVNTFLDEFIKYLSKIQESNTYENEKPHIKSTIDSVEKQALELQKIIKLWTENGNDSQVKEIIGLKVNTLSKFMPNIKKIVERMGIEYTLPFSLKTNYPYHKTVVTPNLVGVYHKLNTELDKQYLAMVSMKQTSMIPYWLRYNYVKANKQLDKFAKASMKQGMEYGYGFDSYELAKNLREFGIPLMDKHELATPYDYVNYVIKQRAKKYSFRIQGDIDTFTMKNSEWFTNLYSDIKNLQKAFKEITGVSIDISKVMKARVVVEGYTVNQIKNTLSHLKKLSDSTGVKFNIELSKDSARMLAKEYGQEIYYDTGKHLVKAFYDKKEGVFKKERKKYVNGKYVSDGWDRVYDESRLKFKVDTDVGDVYTKVAKYETSDYNHVIAVHPNNVRNANKYYGVSKRVLNDLVTRTIHGGFDSTIKGEYTKNLQGLESSWIRNSSLFGYDAKFISDEERFFDMFNQQKSLKAVPKAFINFYNSLNKMITNKSSPRPQSNTSSEDNNIGDFFSILDKMKSEITGEVSDIGDVFVGSSKLSNIIDKLSKNENVLVKDKDGNVRLNVYEAYKLFKKLFYKKGKDGKRSWSIDGKYSMKSIGLLDKEVEEEDLKEFYELIKTHEFTSTKDVLDFLDGMRMKVITGTKKFYKENNIKANWDLLKQKIMKINHYFDLLQSKKMNIDIAYSDNEIEALSNKLSNIINVKNDKISKERLNASIKRILTVAQMIGNEHKIYDILNNLAIGSEYKNIDNTLIKNIGELLEKGVSVNHNKLEELRKYDKEIFSVLGTDYLNSTGFIKIDDNKNLLKEVGKIISNTSITGETLYKFTHNKYNTENETSENKRKILDYTLIANTLSTGTQNEFLDRLIKKNYFNHNEINDINEMKNVYDVWSKFKNVIESKDKYTTIITSLDKYKELSKLMEEYEKYMDLLNEKNKKGDKFDKEKELEYYRNQFEINKKMIPKAMINLASILIGTSYKYAMVELGLHDQAAVNDFLEESGKYINDISNIKEESKKYIKSRYYGKQKLSLDENILNKMKIKDVAENIINTHNKIRDLINKSGDAFDMNDVIKYVDEFYETFDGIDFKEIDEIIDSIESETEKRQAIQIKNKLKKAYNEIRDIKALGDLSHGKGLELIRSIHVADVLKNRMGTTPLGSNFIFSTLAALDQGDALWDTLTKEDIDKKYTEYQKFIKKDKQNELNKYLDAAKEHMKNIKLGDTSSEKIVNEEAMINSATNAIFNMLSENKEELLKNSNMNDITLYNLSRIIATKALFELIHDENEKDFDKNNYLHFTKGTILSEKGIKQFKVLFNYANNMDEYIAEAILGRSYNKNDNKDVEEFARKILLLPQSELIKRVNEKLSKDLGLNADEMLKSPMWNYYQLVATKKGAAEYLKHVYGYNDDNTLYKKLKVVSDEHYENVNSASELANKIIKNNTSDVIIASGDIQNVRKVSVLETNVELMKKLGDNKQGIYLVGNHDYEQNYAPIAVLANVDGKNIIYAHTTTDLTSESGKTHMKFGSAIKKLREVNPNAVTAKDFHVKNPETMSASHGVKYIENVKNASIQKVAYVDENGEIKVVDYDEYKNMLLNDENIKNAIDSYKNLGSNVNDSKITGKLKKIWNDFWNPDLHRFTTKNLTKSEKNLMTVLATPTYFDQTPMQNYLLEHMFKGYTTANQRLATSSSVQGFFTLSDIYNEITFGDNDKNIITALQAEYVKKSKDYLLEDSSHQLDDKVVKRLLADTIYEFIYAGNKEKIFGIDRTSKDYMRVYQDVEKHFNNMKNVLPLMTTKSGKLSTVFTSEEIKMANDMKRTTNALKMFEEQMSKANVNVKQFSKLLNMTFSDINKYKQMGDSEIVKEVIDSMSSPLMEKYMRNYTTETTMSYLGLAQYLRTDLKRSSAAASIEEYVLGSSIKTFLTKNLNVDKNSIDDSEINNIVENLVNKEGLNRIVKKGDNGYEITGIDNSKMSQSQIEKLVKFLYTLEKFMTNESIGSSAQFATSMIGAVASGNQLQIADTAIKIAGAKHAEKKDYEDFFGDIDVGQEKYFGKNDDKFLTFEFDNARYAFNSTMLRNIEWGYAAELQLQRFQKTMDTMSRLKQMDQILKSDFLIKRHFTIQDLPSSLNKMIISKIKSEAKSIKFKTTMSLFQEALQDLDLPGTPDTISQLTLAGFLFDNRNIIDKLHDNSGYKQFLTEEVVDEFGQKQQVYKKGVSNIINEADETKLDVYKQLFAHSATTTYLKRSLEQAIKSSGDPFLVTLSNDPEKAFKEVYKTDVKSKLIEDIRNEETLDFKHYNDLDTYMLSNKGDVKKIQSMVRKISKLNDDVKQHFVESIVNFAKNIDDEVTEENVFEKFTSKEFLEKLNKYDNKEDLVDSFNKLKEKLNEIFTGQFDLLSKDASEFINRLQNDDEFAKGILESVKTSLKEIGKKHLEKASLFNDEYVTAKIQKEQEWYNENDIEMNQITQDLTAFSAKMDKFTNKSLMLSNLLIGPLMGGLGLIWSWQSVEMMRNQGRRSEESLAKEYLKMTGWENPYLGLTGSDWARTAGYLRAMTAVDNKNPFLIEANPIITAEFNQMSTSDYKKIMEWYANGAQTNELPTTSVMSKLTSELELSKESAAELAKQFASANERALIDKKFGFESAALAAPMDAIRINTSMLVNAVLGIYKKINDLISLFNGGKPIESDALYQYATAIQNALNNRVGKHLIAVTDGTNTVSSKLKSMYTESIINTNLATGVENEGSASDESTANYVSDKGVQTLTQETRNLAIGTESGYNLQLITGGLSGLALIATTASSILSILIKGIGFLSSINASIKRMSGAPLRSYFGINEERYQSEKRSIIDRIKSSKAASMITTVLGIAMAYTGNPKKVVGDDRDIDIQNIAAYHGYDKYYAGIYGHESMGRKIAIYDNKQNIHFLPIPSDFGKFAIGIKELTEMKDIDPEVIDFYKQIAKHEIPINRNLEIGSDKYKLVHDIIDSTDKDEQIRLLNKLNLTEKEKQTFRLLIGPKDTTLAPEGVSNNKKIDIGDLEKRLIDYKDDNEHTSINYIENWKKEKNVEKVHKIAQSVINKSNDNPSKPKESYDKDLLESSAHKLLYETKPDERIDEKIDLVKALHIENKLDKYKEDILKNDILVRAILKKDESLIPHLFDINDIVSDEEIHKLRKKAKKYNINELDLLSHLPQKRLKQYLLDNDLNLATKYAVKHNDKELLDKINKKYKGLFGVIDIPFYNEIKGETKEKDNNKPNSVLSHPGNTEPEQYEKIDKTLCSLNRTLERLDEKIGEMNEVNLNKTSEITSLKEQNSNPIIIEGGYSRIDKNGNIIENDEVQREPFTTNEKLQVAGMIGADILSTALYQPIGEKFGYEIADKLSQTMFTASMLAPMYGLGKGVAISYGLTQTTSKIGDTFSNPTGRNVAETIATMTGTALLTSNNIYAKAIGGTLIGVPSVLDFIYPEKKDNEQNNNLPVTPIRIAGMMGDNEVTFKVGKTNEKITPESLQNQNDEDKGSLIDAIKSPVSLITMGVSALSLAYNYMPDRWKKKIKGKFKKKPKNNIESSDKEKNNIQSNEDEFDTNKENELSNNDETKIDEKDVNSKKGIFKRLREKFKFPWNKQSDEISDNYDPFEDEYTSWDDDNVKQNPLEKPETLDEKRVNDIVNDIENKNSKIERYETSNNNERVNDKNLEKSNIPKPKGKEVIKRRDEWLSKRGFKHHGVGMFIPAALPLFGAISNEINGLQQSDESQQSDSLYNKAVNAISFGTDAYGALSDAKDTSTILTAGKEFVKDFGSKTSMLGKVGAIAKFGLSKVIAPITYGYEAYQRYQEGDYLGAAITGGEAVLSGLFPGVGGAISFGIDIVKDPFLKNLRETNVYKAIQGKEKFSLSKTIDDGATFHTKVTADTFRELGDWTGIDAFRSVGDLIYKDKNDISQQQTESLSYEGGNNETDNLELSLNEQTQHVKEQKDILSEILKYIRLQTAFIINNSNGNILL